MHTKPISYRNVRGGIAYGGIRADIIPKICDVWIDAGKAGVLGKRQEKIAAKAELLMRALAHACEVREHCPEAAA